MVTPESIETSIAAASPASTLEVAGDGQHFEAVIVSPRVRGLSRVERHQLVYAALGDRMREEIHALSMTTLTPARSGRERGTPAGTHGQARHRRRRALEGEVRVSGAKNAALPILCAALLRREPLTLTNVPRLNDVRTMQSLLAQMGVRLDASQRRHASTLDAATHRLAARALRAREDDARVDPGARPAARALRRGARVAARRLRDRPAAGRPARQGPAGDGRRDRPRARLHQRAGAAPDRRAVRVRHGHRDRHREPDDGGDARRGHDDARERRARARGRRPRALPHRDGRAHRGRRHRSHRRSKACAACTARRTRSCPTASRRARSSPRPRRRAATSLLRGARPGTLDAVLDKLREAGARHHDRRRRHPRRARRPALRGRSCAPRRIPAFPTDMQAQFMALADARRRRRR